MKMVRDLLTPETTARYQAVSNLNMRSSIYDVTNRCNLRCKGCFFFSSGQDRGLQDEPDIDKWEEFILEEKRRGVNMAILIGGEPTLFPERVERFQRHMKTFCATNGLIRMPRERFPDMMVGISLWGSEEDEIALRGKNTFRTSLEHYRGDPNVYYLYTITPGRLSAVEKMTKRIGDAGLRVHYQLLSNDENVPGFTFDLEEKRRVRDLLDDLLERYPQVVISSHYYHRVLITGEMMGRKWGWMECPSVSERKDPRNPRPKSLPGFNSWASDLKTLHRCCTSDTRNCDACFDGAARMSWVMVNKRLHMSSRTDFENWLEVMEMFAKLYRYVPW